MDIFRSGITAAELIADTAQNPDHAPLFDFFILGTVFLPEISAFHTFVFHSITSSMLIWVESHTPGSPCITTLTHRDRNKWRLLS